MPEKKIFLEIQDVFTSQSNYNFDCNSLTRRHSPGTLNAIRLFQVCYIDTEDNNIVSDEVGMASSSGIIFKRGTEGRYNYKYKSLNGAESKLYSTYVESNVVSVKVITPPIPVGEFGIPLSPQPQILIMGTNGKPIQGKVAIALSSAQYQSDRFILGIRGNIQFFNK